MSDILHFIKAFLYHNLLTDDPNDLVAKVHSEKSIDLPGVCVSATGRGGASGKPGDMEQYVRSFFKEMAFLACDGFSVNLGYFTCNVQVKGVFDSPDEHFDPEKHTVYFHFVQGDTMRQLIPSIEVQIMGMGDTQPRISQVIDVKTGSVNDRITPGKIVKVHGDKIKLAGDHPDVGIWFVAEADGNRTRVEMDEIGTNNPSELTLLAPALDAGVYWLEVITQYSGGAPLLKEPRTASFARALTVD